MERRRDLERFGWFGSFERMFWDCLLILVMKRRLTYVCVWILCGVVLFGGWHF